MINLDYNTRQQLKQFIDTLDGTQTPQMYDFQNLQRCVQELQERCDKHEARIKELEDDASYLLEKDPDYAGAPPCPTT